MSKNPWTKNILDKYLGQEERYELEFKSSRPLLDESYNKVDKFFDDLSADVSAFLNSEGGLIIIGIDEYSQRDAKHAGLAEKLSNGCPRSIFTSARLSNKLIDRIHPACSSLVQVNPVVVDQSGDEDLLAFVIEVKAGITAYQAADKRYYSRRSFGIEPMEDKDIRLRMLTDDRPRAELTMRSVDVSPNNQSWEILERGLREFVRYRIVKKRPEELSQQEILLQAAAMGAIPPEVREARIQVSFSLLNVGNVSIARGALCWNHSEMENSVLKCPPGTKPFDFGTEGSFPLYPEMEREILTCDLICPRSGIQSTDESSLRVDCYLDGGLPVRLNTPVSSFVPDAISVLTNRLAMLRETYQLKSPL